MRPLPSLEPDRRSGRLVARRLGERRELWTETVGRPPPVYGERWREESGRAWRSFEPTRSKLAGGIVAGWRGPLPAPGERWLYLGAATGTTASHVADLVGPAGRVYALERSLRPFARLLSVCERWPNLLPVLGDAREPISYSDLVPPVLGVYADIAQPDQVEIVRKNVELYGSGAGTAVVVALKTASLGRERGASEHLRSAEDALRGLIDLARSVSLERTHRAHYLIGGSVGGSPTKPPVGRGGPSRGPPLGRRRR